MNYQEDKEQQAHQQTINTWRASENNYVKIIKDLKTANKEIQQNSIPISKIEELIISLEYVLGCGASIGLSDVIGDIQKLIDKAKQ